MPLVRTSSEFSTMKQRAITAVFFVAVMLAGVFGGPIPFFLLFGFVAAGAGWELITLCSDRSDPWFWYRRAKGTGLAVLPFLISAWWHSISVLPEWWTRLTQMSPMAVPALLAVSIFLLLLMELALHPKRPFDEAGYYFLALFYVGLPLALLIDVAFSQGGYVPMRVIGILFLNWMNDTFAYLTGSMIGKTPLAPRISPKKTWEGTLGGIFFTILLAWGIARLSPVFSTAEWLVIAACVSVFGTMGDLVESMLKRSVGVKDSGNILPGHGGILDRFDSFIFLLPFVWLALTLIHLFSS